MPISAYRDERKRAREAIGTPALALSPDYTGAWHDRTDPPTTPHHPPLHHPRGSHDRVPAMTGDPALERLRHDALASLHYHWGSAYWVQLIDDETWIASPYRDPATLLTAGTADELRQLIRRDYDSRTVRRPEEGTQQPG